MRQLPFPFLGLEGKSACRREKLVRGGRNLKKNRGEGGSKLETDRKSQPVGEKSLSGAEEICKKLEGRVGVSWRPGGKVSP